MKYLSYSKTHTIHSCGGVFLFICAFIAIGNMLIPPAIAIADEVDNATFAAELNEKEEYVPDEILVILADEANEDTEEIAAVVGGVVKQKISFRNSRKIRRAGRQTKLNRKRVLRIKLPKGKSVKQAIAEQKNKKDPRIVLVEPNYKVRISAIPNDPLFANLWGLKNTGQTGGTPYSDINAESAWDITTGSDDVVVAVIDTGIDYLHPDLAQNMWTNTGEIAGNSIDDDDNGFVDDVYGYDFVSNDGDPMDEHNHGTHCAGTIGARGNNSTGVAGVNWRCKLMACRFLDASGSGSVADAIEGINYAVANGADILSNSWGGGGYSATLEAAIENAKDNGVLFVAAAGNSAENTDVTPHYPSSYDVENVIAVAATDDDDALASFSNYGQHTVHIAAPGVSILSTVRNNAYNWYNGTSMATPHVAGAAALLLANDPTMSVYELKSRLLWTGDVVDSLSTKTITSRRLNVYNALTTEPTLTVLDPNDEVTWVQGFEWPIEWMSVGGGETVDIYLLKAGAIFLQLADDIPNSGKYDWEITEAAGTGSDYRIWIDDGVNSDESDSNFTITDSPTDYFTELFSSDTGRFDLSNKSLLLTPDGSASQYSACLKEITELPVNPTDSTNLQLGDDDYELVTLTGNSVEFYEESYGSFYVTSNGYITFETYDTDYSESISEHFTLKRIAGLFCDLNPGQSGSVLLNEVDDRVVITWLGVPEYGRTNSNTFQIEMFYEGPIRISWLSVEAQYSLVGVSEGLGTGTDFLPSNISSYESCPPEIASIEITGPDSVSEQSEAQFACIAHYENGSTEELAGDLPSWSENSGYASINGSGQLTAGDVDDYQQCIVTATYNGMSDTHSVVITDTAAHIISIQKCRVKASKTTGADAIICSGSFEATIEQFENADNVNIQIYSATDDYLVYEETIALGLFTRTRSGYIYKNKINGGINSLRFDTNKSLFFLKAKNIDLTGLTGPFYILIDLGAYAGLGIAKEDIINGKKSIPVQLLSGYSDTLSITKTRLRDSATAGGDSLAIKGTFTVEDDSAVSDGLTIGWGTQTFTIPGDQFLPVNTNKLQSKYQAPDGTLLYTDFDSSRCIFKIVIKETTLTPQAGTIDFGLEFGNYSQDAEVNM